MIVDAQHHYRGRSSTPAADMATRLKWMDDSRVDMAVLTNNMQYFYDKGLSTWTTWNDELSVVEKEHPDRFIASPSIPIFNGKMAVNELERVVSSNEARTVFIQPYKWRIDYEYLQPFYEKLNDLRIPLFFHPVHTDLSAEEVYGSSGIGAAVGFPFNTSVAISRFMFSGLLDTYPHLKIVVPHLGGALPFLFGRLQGVYDPEKYRSAHPPSHYLDNFFFDVVSYTRETLEFAAKVLGPSRLVFGSDFGCPDKNLIKPLMFQSYIEGLSISHMEKAKILGENLSSVLKIENSTSQQEQIRAPAVPNTAR
jgi:aminocarboxymuconate-semialdehyde decarboxylase